MEGSIPLAMNIGGVYTRSILIVCPYTPFRGVYTPRDEYWRGVHPSNIHCVPHFPVSPIKGSIPFMLNIGGVYTRPIFIVCPHTSC